MKKTCSLLLVATLGSPAALSDTLGVTIGAAGWRYDISGTARYQSDDPANNVDLKRDLGYNDDSLVFFYAQLEHPVPLLPSIKVRYSQIDTSANGRLTKTFTYGGVVFNVGEDVSSEAKLDKTDITLFYSPLDNLVNLDLGLTASYIDGRSSISGATSGTSTADVSGWVPMIYAGIGVDLPLTGLSVSADGAGIKYKDSDFYDFSIRASYTTPWYLGFNVGYRKLKLNLDDFDDSYADVEFDGPFAGAYFQF